MLLLLQLLQPAAAVRYRVPDGKNCCCGSLHLIPELSISSFKHEIFSMYPLAVPSRRFFTDNTYHTTSVITGMRGAKAGVPAPAEPPCMLVML